MMLDSESPPASQNRSVLQCSAIFLSDLHLGSNQCEAQQLARFIDQIQPEVLYLIGDIFDLQAIRINANVSESFLIEAIQSLVVDGSSNVLESGRFSGKKLLRQSHLLVLSGLRALLMKGVRIVYIPGNHDAYLRKFAGWESGSLAVRMEDVYEGPDGRRLLVRHGDEFDRLIRLQAGIAGRLITVQESYSGWINGLRGLLTSWQPSGDAAVMDPEAILGGAVDLLARHWDWPVPTHRGLDSSGGFSLAFAMESLIKRRTGHDRIIKRMMTLHLMRERRAGRCFDGVINGHTHIPEATAFALPGERVGESPGPCHITYYNDGSWARSQKRLGRTALVVNGDGTIGMVRFDRRNGIVPFQPPRFPFNTYSTRSCRGCGLPVADPFLP